MKCAKVAGRFWCRNGAGWRGSATEMAFFGAERVPGGNFATILALFGAKLRRRRGFATEMAFFGAVRVPGGNFGTKMAFFGAKL